MKAELIGNAHDRHDERLVVNLRKGDRHRWGGIDQTVVMHNSEDKCISCRTSNSIHAFFSLIAFDKEKCQVNLKVQYVT